MKASNYFRKKSFNEQNVVTECPSFPYGDVLRTTKELEADRVAKYIWIIGRGLVTSDFLFKYRSNRSRLL